jgi:hypothetical protein
VHDDARLDDPGPRDLAAADRDVVEMRPVGDPLRGVLKLSLRPDLLGGEADLLDPQRDGVEAGDVPRLLRVGDEARVVALGVVGAVRGRLSGGVVEPVAQTLQVADARDVGALGVVQNDQDRLQTPWRLDWFLTFRVTSGVGAIWPRIVVSG